MVLGAEKEGAVVVLEVVEVRAVVRVVFLVVGIVNAAHTATSTTGQAGWALYISRDSAPREILQHATGWLGTGGMWDVAEATLGREGW